VSAVVSAAAARRLVRAARGAQARAYAPYSKFAVGAAVLTGRGRVVTGANVENASYGLTVCAERVAVHKAIADGDRRIQAVAIAGPRAIAPCGACRQVLSEFGAPAILLAGPKGPYQLLRFQDLFPMAFALDGEPAEK
jgi:cytidine deaminase